MEDAVSYCEEYFEEAGDGNDQQVIDDLGTPAQFAAQLKAERSIRQEQQHRNHRRGNNPNSSLKNAGMIILGICALPIALPLLFAAIAVMFALVITVFALGVAGIVSFASILITGIPLMASAVTNYHTPSNHGLRQVADFMYWFGLTAFCFVFFTHSYHAACVYQCTDTAFSSS